VEGTRHGIIYSDSECTRLDIEEVEEEKKEQRRLIRWSEGVGREGGGKEM
jgi:hypothetical protein